MDHFGDLMSLVRDALYSVENGGDATEELKSLAKQASLVTTELERQASELAGLRAAQPAPPAHVKARAVFISQSIQQRDAQRFLLSYAGGGEEIITSWRALAKRIRLSEASIRVYLSKGRGAFCLERYNPLTQERDALTIARVTEQNKVITKVKMGRPRTRPLTEEEMAVD